MTPLRCSIASINLPTEETPDGRYYVRHNGIIREQTIYNKVAERSGLSPMVARAVGELLFRQIAEELQAGHRVELPELSAFLTVTGKKVAATRDRTGTEPTPAVHLAPKGVLKDCCKDALAVEVVTKQAAVAVHYFCDRYIKDGAVGNGTEVKVSLVGGLYMPDLNDDTVGVWIEDSDGNLKVKANVQESTRTTLSVVFPKIDLPVGKGYYMCVASRDGLPGIHSVKTVRRRLTILGDLPEPKRQSAKKGRA